MYNIAIVEDDVSWKERLEQYIKKYEAESGYHFTVSSFSDGLDILSDYKPVYDIIFFDIEMAHSNGIDIAAKIRDIDESVIIIFVTNMAQYALKGYTVNAMDFVVKPAKYYDIAYRLDKAVKVLERMKKKEIILTYGRDIRKVDVSDIYYIEVVKTHLVYHTSSGDIEVRDTLQNAEKKIGCDYFVRCNSGYLVNLQYVTKISGNEVCVAGDRLLISRNKRAGFIDSVTTFTGGK